jgi:S1-C subfamily serine protease
MAEALAEAHRLDPGAIVVGIVGRGHLEHGYGIPHQLADLGIDDVAVLLPVDAGADCAALEAGLADAVFVTEASADVGPAPRPRLGVLIENAALGVRVMEVVADSVADQSGLQAGDIILRAAGFDTATTTALIEVIERQAPGTWLPLAVVRDKREFEVIARFPQDFE